MSIVERYWVGVLDRLQAEVDVLAELVKHAGEKGRENEAALQRVLERLLPRRYGIGTGMLIDTHDSYSKQMDIILYDLELHPALFSQTTTLLYPHESVHGCIEVKTRLRSSDIEDIKSKCRSVKELFLEDEDVYASRVNSEGFQVGYGKATHPFFATLAYATDMRPSSIVASFQEAPPFHRPDLICVLDAGLIGGASVGDTSRGAFNSGIVSLQRRDEQGRRVQSETTFTGAERLQTIPIDGRWYPVVQRGKDQIVVEPARAFLIFLSLLLDALNDRHLSPRSLTQRYLSREFMTLQPAVPDERSTDS